MSWILWQHNTTRCFCKPWPRSWFLSWCQTPKRPIISSSRLKEKRCIWPWKSLSRGVKRNWVSFLRLKWILLRETVLRGTAGTLLRKSLDSPQKNKAKLKTEGHVWAKNSKLNHNTSLRSASNQTGQSAQVTFRYLKRLRLLRQVPRGRILLWIKELKPSSKRAFKDWSTLVGLKWTI